MSLKEAGICSHSSGNQEDREEDTQSTYSVARNTRMQWLQELAEMVHKLDEEATIKSAVMNATSA